LAKKTVYDYKVSTQDKSSAGTQKKFSGGLTRGGHFWHTDGRFFAPVVELADT
jgi:hypothetical protein